MCTVLSAFDMPFSELQIRGGGGGGGGIEDNLKKIFLFFNKNICRDTSLEFSRLDGSNDGSQNMCQCKLWVILLKLSVIYLLI